MWSVIFNSKPSEKSQVIPINKVAKDFYLRIYIFTYAQRIYMGLIILLG